MWKAVVENAATEKNKEQIMKRAEENLRDLWDNIKHTNICIIGVTGGEEKISREITAENFPNTGKETLSQGEESQRIPHRINPKRNTARHILIKLTKLNTKKKY